MYDHLWQQMTNILRSRDQKNLGLIFMWPQPLNHKETSFGKKKIYIFFSYQNHSKYVHVMSHGRYIHVMGVANTQLNTIHNFVALSKALQLI